MRQSPSNDGLGVNEPLSDWSPDSKGVNYTATFKLALTHQKEELVKLLYKQHSLDMSHPLYLFGSKLELPIDELAGPKYIEQEELKRKKTFELAIVDNGIIDL
jgi:hypothetical protein